MSETTIRGTLTIATEQCKGCELCIPACPPEVLRMSEARNEIGAHYPELLPGCTVTTCGWATELPQEGVQRLSAATW